MGTLPLGKNQTEAEAIIHHCLPGSLEARLQQWTRPGRAPRPTGQRQGCHLGCRCRLNDKPSPGQPPLTAKNRFCSFTRSPESTGQEHGTISVPGLQPPDITAHFWNVPEVSRSCYDTPVIYKSIKSVRKELPRVFCKFQKNSPFRTPPACNRCAGSKPAAGTGKKPHHCRGQHPEDESPSTALVSACTSDPSNAEPSRSVTRPQLPPSAHLSRSRPQRAGRAGSQKSMRGAVSARGGDAGEHCRSTEAQVKNARRWVGTAPLGPVLLQPGLRS
jgi:hypothetical protein